MLSEEPSVTLMKTMKKIEKKNSKDKRFLANEMHRQADNLNKKGDYETALILYHRASNLYPHDACHIIAARKIKTSIKNEYLKSDSNIIKYNIDNNSIKSRNLRRKKSNKLAFNKLSINIKNELTKAWLFHEIGNCYYEMGLYKKSLNMAKQCCECSADNETIKWALQLMMLE
ncbi:uncharacterized protein LOC122853686 [Aphidius gifuensis]|uniref:uncharacterized protein LOC122853686 n=1 Tax=Aphidius gifuensis TaxID=684658 RepID=UPI001CDC7243|nr:uncharacterized protein LOC122853686 [Aphidius gifuensis]